MNPNKIALLLGALVMSVYLALLPFINRTWRATGDEPHYLLTAHSLAVDGDFDLKNNYQNRDYLNFYLSYQITPQIRENSAGEHLLNHYPGLPVIIALPYKLGGRLGVLLFQVFLGGILAAYMFKLAHFISQHALASILATLSIAFSAPFLHYHYLIYPEIISALSVLLICYYAIAHTKPTPFIAGLVFIALILLPWLNRRFVLLAITLGIGVAWSWRKVDIPWWQGMLRGAGRPALALVALSSLGVWWFNSQLQAPSRVDIILPMQAQTISWRLLRGLGWLVDQQRGLFIFGPIFITTLFGLPWLKGAHGSRRWLILWPFCLLLATTLIAGGYWIAWEVGPRYVVAALPLLAPLLALSWQYYGNNTLGAILLTALLALSLLNSAVIIRNPQTPYSSSLALYYEAKLKLPLSQFLPDLAERTQLYPATETNGSTPVIIPPEKRESIIQPRPLSHLPYGRYQLLWPLKIEPDLPPETEILRLSATSRGGGQIFSRVVQAGDFSSNGEGTINLNFLNPEVNRWQKPVVIQAISSGQSAIWPQTLIIRPQFWSAWGLSYFYLGLLIGGAGIAWFWRKRAGSLKPLPGAKIPQVGGSWLVAVAVALPLITSVYVATQLNQSRRVYDANQFLHISGQPQTDPSAVDGQAWLVDNFTHSPGKAIYGPFDFYDAGIYTATFKLKLPQAVESEQPLALLNIQATSDFERLLSQPLLAEHFSEPGQYHHFVLSFHNPRRQALSFEVDYLGEAALLIDEVTIEKAHRSGE